MQLIKKMKEPSKKTINEKRVSLFPLDFEKALAAFLKVKSKSKKEIDEAIKASEKKKKPAILRASGSFTGLLQPCVCYPDYSLNKKPTCGRFGGRNLPA